ncbi:MAG: phosphoribosylformylglycinamidine cyclo-ligase [Lentisphaerae bacterium]|nr:phosphoribosylformylglycinamidine cyclo-ligase [Lentisphaerota bacterium]
MAKRPSAYAKAGVDIDEMMSALSAVKTLVKRTAVKGVLSDIGSFGGLFNSPGKEEVLVASTDGVGTKLSVAVKANRHDTVGRDLVNHCVNDILVQGARPLFFLDYLGTSRLSGSVFQNVVRGLSRACRENGCALLGGETAEMPGLYPKGKYDLVGTVVGAVPRRSLVTGETIRAGDVLIGLRSTGLHTNGYSLAREIVFKKARLGLDDPFPGTKRSVSDTLLAVHKSYLLPVQRLMQRIRVRGMAHITGGGLVDNVPRILPDGVTAVIDRKSWKVPALFSFLEETGRVDEEEMYRVFNMGIGFVIIVRRKDVEESLAVLRELRTAPRIIGGIEKGSAGMQFTA